MKSFRSISVDDISFNHSIPNDFGYGQKVAELTHVTEEVVQRSKRECNLYDPENVITLLQFKYTGISLCFIV
jgi:hypothetical protein